jgi:hypothetical protein
VDARPLGLTAGGRAFARGLGGGPGPRLEAVLAEGRVGVWFEVA